MASISTTIFKEPWALSKDSSAARSTKCPSEKPLTICVVKKTEGKECTFVMERGKTLLAQANVSTSLHFRITSFAAMGQTAPLLLDAICLIALQQGKDVETVENKPHFVRYGFKKHWCEGLGAALFLSFNKPTLEEFEGYKKRFFPFFVYAFHGLPFETHALVFDYLMNYRTVTLFQNPLTLSRHIFSWGNQEEGEILLRIQKGEVSVGEMSLRKGTSFYRITSLINHTHRGLHPVKGVGTLFCEAAVFFCLKDLGTGGILKVFSASGALFFYAHQGFKLQDPTAIAAFGDNMQALSQKWRAKTITSEQLEDVSRHYECCEMYFKYGELTAEKRLKWKERLAKFSLLV